MSPETTGTTLGCLWHFFKISVLRDGDREERLRRWAPHVEGRPSVDDVIEAHTGVSESVVYRYIPSILYYTLLSLGRRFHQGGTTHKSVVSRLKRLPQSSTRPTSGKDVNFHRVKKSSVSASLCKEVSEGSRTIINF